MKINLNDEDRNIKHCFSSTELNNGDIGNTDPGSDRLAKDNDKPWDDILTETTRTSLETCREKLSNMGQNQLIRFQKTDDELPTRRNLKAIAFHGPRGIDSVWDGCTKFKEKDYFHPEFLEQLIMN
ncbi:hypothetical protein OS493_003233 [Desmophyllum pertusum]|uniref:Uncharacterized protein n=1 Tax=Desmophyllum pertusum TaxID=174260 RepID=A0A9W9YI94_9CNID|nr:hypothetical protein OS493_003233 [Desmophyllum pertusum]